MPSLIDNGGRVDDLVDACVHLIETEGVTALTMRKIGAVLRLSPSSLTGGGVALIEEELRVSVEAAYRRPRLDPDVEIIVSLAVGLWAAMCAGDGPMPADRARELISRAEAALGLQVPRVEPCAPQTTASQTSASQTSASQTTASQTTESGSS